MDQRRQKAFIFGVVGIAVVFYGAARFWREDDESRVRKAVYAGVVAVEREDIGRLSALIDESYADSAGENKAGVLRLVLAVFRDHRDFRLHIGKLNIAVRSGEADAEISFKLFFRKNAQEELYYDTGQVKLVFVRDGRFWRIRSAEYLGSDQLLFLPVVAGTFLKQRSEA
jgi:hypothetical protein